MTAKDIQKAAHEFLNSRWKDKGFPVDVELLVEKEGFDIIPLPGLRSQIGIDACSRIDTKEMYVDNDFYLNDKLVNRLRFTLAHELGHFVLHENEYRDFESAAIQVKSSVEWARLVRDDLLVKSVLESEADEFAGELLAPYRTLAPLLPDAIAQVQQETQRRGWDFNVLSDDTVRALLGSIIAPYFAVTNTVVEIRIRKHSLYPARER